MMDCKEFKKYVDDYVGDSDLDWKIRYEMDAHLFECEKCQKAYALATLVTTEEVMHEPILKVHAKAFTEKILAIQETGTLEDIIGAVQEELKLRAAHEIIQGILISDELEINKFLIGLIYALLTFGRFFSAENKGRKAIAEMYEERPAFYKEWGEVMFECFNPFSKNSPAEFRIHVEILAEAGIARIQEVIEKRAKRAKVNAFMRDNLDLAGKLESSLDKIIEEMIAQGVLKRT